MSRLNLRNMSDLSTQSQGQNGNFSLFFWKITSNPNYRATQIELSHHAWVTHGLPFWLVGGGGRCQLLLWARPGAVSVRFSLWLHVPEQRNRAAVPKIRRPVMYHKVQARRGNMSLSTQDAPTSAQHPGAPSQGAARLSVPAREQRGCRR